MTNRQGRSPGNLTKLNTQGQVSTKPTTAVDPNVSIFYALQRDLQRMGSALSQMAHKAMARQKTASIEAGKTQGHKDAYSVDLGTGSNQTAGEPSDIGNRLMVDMQKDLNLTKAQAAGFVGNLAHESGNFKTLQEVSPLVKGSRGGFGYAQWTGPRRRQFEAFAQEKGLDPASYEANYGFLIHELTNSPEGSVLDALRQAGDAQSAAEIVSKKFLRPGIPHMKSRMKWASRFANSEVSAGAPVAGSGRPGPTGPALALRSDDTPGGKAYNATLNRDLARRVPVEINQKIDEIYEEHKDDPTALTKALDAAQKEILGNISSIPSDPAVQWLAEQTFARKRLVFERSAIAEQDKRVREGERSNYDAALTSQFSSLEKQAYLVGDDIQAGADLEISMNEALGNIEEARFAGVISPKLAEKQKREVLGTVTSARLRGVFDSLPDADSKEAYVAEMRKQWSSGAEEFASLSLDQVRAIERNFKAVISQERRQAHADARIQSRKMERLINDDLASISRDGVGLAIDGAELTFDQVSSILGKERATEWDRKRDISAASYQAISGLDVLPADEIAEQLQKLEPKPGIKGYVDQLEILSNANKAAQQILKLRKSDPAQAVDEAFDELVPLKDEAMDGDLASLEELIKGRFDAQEVLGIPDKTQAPLTLSELTALAEPVAKDPDKQTWLDLAGKIDQTYGPFADEVMIQVMRWKGLHKDVAEAAVGHLRNIELGKKPSRSEARTIEDKAQASSATQSLEGQYDQVKWKEQPTGSAISLLRDNPDKAGEFDQKFGDGAADYYLRAIEAARQETERYQATLDNHGITIHEDGSEDYDPAKDRRK
ncbi:phage tail tip lysozyme [Cohaesibacter gelatinilyticus]|uniref:Phage tail lysozyme domain-containing protein n=1 Tax=Cohaesibacter gelatinilyticus TaxID=372072 RepID=A0A285PI52_9HYPH|nr:phage tail tip lysozyme [Cohaesibacter gelatinilyticus]SNZ20953.1 hypothetical protein SAMN06265368_4067 [Cohaesibacter gelatinilyticus]